MTATHRHLFVVGAVGLIALTFSFFFVGLPRLARSTDPHDGGKNYTMARNVAFHGALSDALAPPFFPSARKAPLYPIFLGGLLKLGLPPAAALGVQFLLATITPLLIYLIAREFLRPTAALATGLIIALNPMQLALPSTFDDAWFFEILWLGGMLFFVRVLMRDAPFRRDLAIAACLFGLSGLARPLTMTLWPLLALGLFLRFGRTAWRQVVLLVAVLAIIWAPWFARNWYHFKTVFITTQDAYILTWDSYSFYRADREGISRPEAHRRIIAEIEAETGRTNLPFPGDEIDDPYLNDPQFAAYLKRYVFRKIAADPLGYARSHLRHALPFWTGSSLREFLASANLYPAHLLATLPNFTREITGGNVTAVRDGLTRLGPWLVLFILDFLLFTATLYAAAAAGIIRFLRSDDVTHRVFGIVVLIMLVAATLITSGVYIGPRYRFPFEPFIWMFAVASLARNWRRA